MNFLLKVADAARKVLRKGVQRRDIDLDAGILHVGEHRDQRTLDGLIDRRHALFAKPRAQDSVQSERDIGVFGRIVERLVERHPVEGDGVPALAADAFVADALMAEMQARELVHAVAVAGAVEHIGQHHRVVDGRDAYAMPGEDFHVVFDVLSDLQHGVGEKQRGQYRKRGIGGELLRRFRLQQFRCQVVPDGDVTGPAGRHGERKAHEAGALRVQAVGLRVDGDDAGLETRFDPTP